MPARRNELTALLIAPNRALAEQFISSQLHARAFNLVGDLKAYPTAATLDMRMRQLRPDVILIDLGTNLDTACDLARQTVTPLPMTALASALYRLLKARGRGKEDPAALISLLG